MSYEIERTTKYKPTSKHVRESALLHKPERQHAEHEDPPGGVRLLQPQEIQGQLLQQDVRQGGKVSNLGRERLDELTQFSHFLTQNCRLRLMIIQV